jgi:formate dehydrogenase
MVIVYQVMQILGQVRNYIPAYNQVLDGEWDVARVAQDSYDLENMKVGTVAIGRIGRRILQRLKPFDVELHYASTSGRRHTEDEQELGLIYHETVEEMVDVCDVITINCPLTDDTRDLFNEKMLRRMKRGAYLVNTARAPIVNRDDLIKVMKDEHLAGYSGDTW